MAIKYCAKAGITSVFSTTISGLLPRDGLYVLRTWRKKNLMILIALVLNQYKGAQEGHKDGHWKQETKEETGLQRSNETVK